MGEGKCRMHVRVSATGSLFSPSIVWFLGFEPRWSALMASARLSHLASQSLQVFIFWKLRGIRIPVIYTQVS